VAVNAIGNGIANQTIIPNESFFEANTDGAGEAISMRTWINLIKKGSKDE
jgi:hypothetical protein